MIIIGIKKTVLFYIHKCGHEFTRSTSDPTDYPSFHTVKKYIPALCEYCTAADTINKTLKAMSTEIQHNDESRCKYYSVVMTEKRRRKLRAMVNSHIRKASYI